jgi:hypothetical protein
VDQVVVIEDQGEWRWRCGDVVNQAGEERFGRKWLRGLKYGLGALANAWINILQRCNQIGEETSRVIIGFVEGKPSARMVHALQPLRDQCRFAKAGWRGNQGQLAAQNQTII